MATCYDNRAIVSRAAAVLHAVIAWTGSFIRHACTSHNETGEGVSVSWWLASLLCFLLFALERRTRAIVLPQTVSLYRPGEFYCSHRFHWGIYMPFQPFLFTHSLLNLSATTMYLQHFMLIFQTESGFSKKRCSDVQDWGQVCSFQGKNCGGFGAFTTSKHQPRLWQACRTTCRGSFSPSQTSR